MSKIRSDRRIASSVVCAVTAIVSADARAEPPAPAPASVPAPAPPASDDPKALYREGARLYDVGEYARAATLFQRAYMMTGAPVLLLNLAQAERLGGACGESAASYRRYLEREPADTHRPEIERRVADMDRCAAAKEPPPVRAIAAPSGADAQAGARAAPPRAASSWRTVALVGVGASAVGAATFGVGIGLTFAAKSSLDRDCAPSGACPRGDASHLHAYEGWRVVAIAGGAITIAGAATAILGFVESARANAPRRARSTGAVAIAPWVGIASAGVIGTFE